MQKKTSAFAGLAIAAAGGVLLTSSPAQAQSTLAHGALVQRHHHRSHHFRHGRGHGISNVNLNRIQNRVIVGVRNSNNNVAIASRRGFGDRFIGNRFIGNPFIGNPFFRQRFLRHRFLDDFDDCDFSCGRRFRRFDRDGDGDGGARVFIGDNFLAASAG